MNVVLRCDGDDRVGAGHVARMLQVAASFARAGHTAELVGRYGGLAAELVDAAGVATRPPDDGPLGVGPGADVAVVDSYEVPRDEVGELAARVPTAVLWDDGPPLPGTLLVHYHPSALPGDPGDTPVLLGPAYAPVAPRFAAARRSRGLSHALVSVGGSETGIALAGVAERALEAIGGVRVVVAGPRGRRDVGLWERVAEADVAVAAAGATAYELACAGVPTVAVAMAPNQQPVARGLEDAGAVLGVDVPAGGLEAALGDRVAALGDQAVRERLAARGPAVVDGGGAARIRDALLAQAEGRQAPAPIRFRPLLAEDARRLHEWRSDPAVRAASRATGEVAWEGHVAWLEGALADPARTLWVAVGEPGELGSVRFDRDGRRAEISVAIAAGHRGAGLGTRVIRESTELYLAAHGDVQVVEAHVRAGNGASLAAFERAGYRRAHALGDMAVLEARPVSA